MAGWEEQIGRTNNLFENEQISLEEKNEKILLVEKIRNNKVAMIDYAHVLFENIMRDDSSLENNKHEQLEHILQSLNSLSSLPPSENHPQMEEAVHEKEENHPENLETSMEEESEIEVKPDMLGYFGKSSGFGVVESSSYETPNYSESQESKESPLFSKEQLRLDIRLDEVKFGTDDY